MKLYNIYIIISKKRIFIYSNFIKKVCFFLYKLKIDILEILDFGYYFLNNKLVKLFFLKVNCYKKTISYIINYFNFKNYFLINFILLKKKINIYIQKLNLLSIYVSKNFKIFSSILKKIKYKNHSKFSKIIKILRLIQIIPNNFNSYIKKINLFYDK